MDGENQLNNKTDGQSVSKPENSEQKQRKGVAKKEKKKPAEDAYLIADANKVKSLKAVIANRVVEILKEEPFLSEKELIIRLLAKDERVKKYYVETQDLTYIRFVIWELSKKKVILKAKVLGDEKYTYYFLPSQVDMIKDKVIRAPKQ